MESDKPRPAFAAQAAGITEENETLTLGLASERSGTYEHYLLLSISTQCDEQDEALGLTGIYVELDSQRNSNYFDEVRAGMSDLALTLWLRGRRSTRGLADGELIIDLKLSAGDMETLRTGTGRIQELALKRRH